MADVVGCKPDHVSVEIQTKEINVFAKRKSIAISIAIAATFNLTACDPPMPPEVAAQILEQSYTCEPGTAVAKFPADMADPAVGWADSLFSSCVDPLPTMELQIAEANDFDLLVNAYPSDICKPAFTLPFAIEAADFVFQLADSSSLNLSAKSMAAILNGEITNWADPRIAKENDGSIFPDLAITVRKKADELALSSLLGWLANSGQEVSSARFSAVADLGYEPLVEGEVAIMPHSQVMANGLYSASLITGKDHETGEVLVAVADTVGISSGASQLAAIKNGEELTVKLDPSIPPRAQEGLDVAAPPYQAIYPVNLYACGEDSLVKRAISLFLLRLDSQGALAASNYNQLPEQIRFEALDIARRGLPTPAPLPVD